MLTLDIFVVLYQRKPEDSETLTTLSRIDFLSLGFDVECHIWDNAASVSAPPEQGFLPFKWRYISSRDNEPLSKVYNALISDTIGSLIIIFDQDSLVDESFFRSLAKSTLSICADVFVPVIKHDGYVISPGRLRWIKGAPLHHLSLNTMLPRHFTAMMSGLCIERSFLLRLGSKPFDERLRFYGVDTRFCRDLAINGGRAYVHDAVLGHDSALRSVTDSRAALDRQIWLWQSWLRVFDRNAAEVIAIRCYVLWKVWCTSWRQRMAVRFRELVVEVFR
ncbi:glycosyltransferase [Paraburkholderia caribensis]|uniref:Glycosyltransferase n=1 Tax=Paraburkholderia caribensis TaxID=75105 RepID=A0ABV0DRY5_9BURK|nr:glycosyltransferase [Paraburkholderia caribensis]MCO4880892.1 glycosyltransferase [Paraburkholderia caribensis]CAG9226058.1 Glyco_trans_2-like domain-containing protein [Paraburkholderia caribensis]